MRPRPELHNTEIETKKVVSRVETTLVSRP